MFVVMFAVSLLQVRNAQKADAAAAIIAGQCWERERG